MCIGRTLEGQYGLDCNAHHQIPQFSSNFGVEQLYQGTPWFGQASPPTTREYCSSVPSALDQCKENSALFPVTSFCSNVSGYQLSSLVQIQNNVTSSKSEGVGGSIAISPHWPAPNSSCFGQASRPIQEHYASVSNAVTQCKENYSLFPPASIRNYSPNVSSSQSSSSVKVQGDNFDGSKSNLVGSIAGVSNHWSASLVAASQSLHSLKSQSDYKGDLFRRDIDVSRGNYELRTDLVSQELGSFSIGHGTPDPKRNNARFRADMPHHQSLSVSFDYCESLSSCQRKKRSIERRKEKSRNAARQRRSVENEIFDELASFLPIPSSSFSTFSPVSPDRPHSNSHLDKASVIRLAITYLRNRFLVRYGLPENCSQKQEAPWTGSPSINDPDLETSLSALEGFVLVLTNDADIVYSSENVSSILGLAQIDIIGQSLFDYIHPCDFEEVNKLCSYLATPSSVAAPSLSSRSSLDLEDGSSVLKSRKKLQSSYKHSSPFHSSSPLLSPMSTTPHTGDSVSSATPPTLDDGCGSIFVRFKCTITPRGRNVNLKSASYKVVRLTFRYLFPSVSKDEEEEGSCPPAGRGGWVVALAEKLPHPSNVEVPLNKQVFVSRLSLDATLTYVDDNVNVFCGFDPHELMGMSWHQLYHAFDTQSMNYAFKTLYSKGQVETGYYRFLAKGGGYLWVVTQATLINFRGKDSKSPQCIVCLNYVVSGVESAGVIFSEFQVETPREKPEISLNLDDIRATPKFSVIPFVPSNIVNSASPKLPSSLILNSNSAFRSLPASTTTVSSILSFSPQDFKDVKPLIRPYSQGGSKCAPIISSLSLKSELKPIYRHPSEVTSTSVLPSQFNFQPKRIISSVSSAAIPTGNASCQSAHSPTGGKNCSSLSLNVSELPIASSSSSRLVHVIPEQYTKEDKDLFTPSSLLGPTDPLPRVSPVHSGKRDNSSLSNSLENPLLEVPVSSSSSSSSSCPVPATCNLLRERTKDMNEGFVTLEGRQTIVRSTKAVKEEPDDLTHLAPLVGDDCVPVFWTADGDPDFSPREIDLPSLTEENSPQSHSIAQLEKFSSNEQLIVDNQNIFNSATVETFSRPTGGFVESLNQYSKSSIAGGLLDTLAGESVNPSLCSTTVVDDSNLFCPDLDGIDSDIFTSSNRILDQEKSGLGKLNQDQGAFKDFDHYLDSKGFRNLNQEGEGGGLERIDRDNLEELYRDQEGLQFLDQEEIINDLVSSFYSLGDNCNNNGKSEFLNIASNLDVFTDSDRVFSTSDLNKKSFISEKSTPSPSSEFDCNFVVKPALVKNSQPTTSALKSVSSSSKPINSTPKLLLLNGDTGVTDPDSAIMPEFKDQDSVDIFGSLEMKLEDEIGLRAPYILPTDEMLLSFDHDEIMGISSPHFGLLPESASWSDPSDQNGSISCNGNSVLSSNCEDGGRSGSLEYCDYSLNGGEFKGIAETRSSEDFTTFDKLCCSSTHNLLVSKGGGVLAGGDIGANCVDPNQVLPGQRFVKVEGTDLFDKVGIESSLKGGAKRTMNESQGADPPKKPRLNTFVSSRNLSSNRKTHLNSTLYTPVTQKSISLMTPPTVPKTKEPPDTPIIQQLLSTLKMETTQGKLNFPVNKQGRIELTRAQLTALLSRAAAPTPSPSTATGTALKIRPNSEAKLMGGSEQVRSPIKILNILTPPPVSPVTPPVVRNTLLTPPCGDFPHNFNFFDHSPKLPETPPLATPPPIHELGSGDEKPSLSLLDMPPPCDDGSEWDKSELFLTLDANI